MSKKRVDDSAYEAEYPYIQVMETESGHTIHYDDTPGKERLLIAHMSGSYIEWRPDGGVQAFSTGDSKVYSKSGMSTSIDENVDTKIQGHSRLLVSGGVHIEVAGDAGIAVGGKAAVVGMDVVNVRAKSMHLSTDGDMAMNAGGNMDIKVAGNYSAEVNGDTTIKTGGSSTIETSGDHTEKASNIHLNP